MCVVLSKFSSLFNRERANLTKGNRRLEKKLKEAALGMEEERRNTDQYKDQVIIPFICQSISSVSILH